jgi:flagellar protein FlbT
MSALILDMRPNDMIIINGAPIRVHGKVRLELNGHARFLFGKQIMGPGENNSPARRIYYAIQTAYIGNEHERGGGRADARRFCEDFAGATTSETVRGMLAEAMRAVDEDRCYQALKIVKRIVAHEDAVMAMAAEAGTETGTDAAPDAGRTGQTPEMESAA